MATTGASPRTVVMATAVLLALASACAPRQLVYLPDPEVAPASGGSARFALTEVQAPTLATGLGVALQVDAPAELAITAAHVAPGGGTPCGGSATPGAIAVAVMALDGRRQWERPLRVNGSHLVTLDFALPPADEKNDDDHRPTLESVDVAFTVGAAGAQCVRLPLRAPGGRLARRGPWSLGRSVRADAPLLDAFTGVARLGRWFGPVRLGGELGGAVRRCPGCLSPLYLAAPAALTLDVVAATRAGAGLGLELAYAVRPTLGPEAGDRYLLHGPRVTLRFVSAAAWTFGLPGGPQRRFTSFDLILARQTAAGIDHWAQTVFSVGWTWDAAF